MNNWLPGQLPGQSLVILKVPVIGGVGVGVGVTVGVGVGVGGLKQLFLFLLSLEP